jgi:DNA polymerase
VLSLISLCGAWPSFLVTWSQTSFRIIDRAVNQLLKLVAMLDSETRDLQAQADSLISWWRDAGVDVLIDEEPRNWLAEAKPVAGAGPVEAREAFGQDARPAGLAPATVAASPKLPDNLPDFIDWFATDTLSLSDFAVRQRLRPEGNPSNNPMIITDVPERGDAVAGHLLSGEIGALFDRMIAAWKIDRAHIYLTAIAPGRPASGQIDAASLEVLGPILKHHIRLAAPKKLWLMGEAASRAVLGTNVAEVTGRLHQIDYGGGTVEAIATLHPRVLLREPKSKARVWEDMQRLIGDVKA